MNSDIIRYEYAGEQFIYVELSEAMSIRANFYSMIICNKLEEKKIEGIMDICPSNACYMVRFNTDIIHPDEVIQELKKLEQEALNLHEIEVNSRVIDIPIYFGDPWTHETAMKNRDRHQDPTSTSDIDFCRRLNGFNTNEEFLDAVSSVPYLVTMMGYIPGHPWLFQLVPQEKQLQAPTYKRGRTFTPGGSVGLGGCFRVIYPKDAPGGTQLLGRTPIPVYDESQRLPDFKESPILLRQGDIVNFKRCSPDEYDRIRREVEKGSYKINITPITFTSKEVLESENLDSFSKKIKAMGGQV